MKTHCLTLCLFLICLLAAASGDGQTPQPESHSQPRIGQATRSPEVQPDGRVSFRFRAPNAREVFLARDDAPQLAMTRGDQGIWSVTTAPLPPDLYSYMFVVDGVTLADPANPLCKPIITGGNESLVHVPGPYFLSWEDNDVPHGTLHLHRYRSADHRRGARVLVYTPPGYDPTARHRTYPVLYLLHGVMDDASAWTTAGRAAVILDNLIAQHQARPMLVVMPLGYGFTNVADRMALQFGGPSDQKKIMDVFTSSLLAEVIPQVERAYLVTQDRAARAIAGLSMGGSQALYIGLNHLDCFAWIGSFSGAFIMYGASYEKWFPDLSVQTNRRLSLLWLACGTDDFLFGANRKCRDWLQAKQVRFTAIDTPSAHTWPVWRRNLTEFVPLLFQANLKATTRGDQPLHRVCFPKPLAPDYVSP